MCDLWVMYGRVTKSAQGPVIIYREGGGAGANKGGSPFFMQKFKGGPQENMQMYKPIKC